jgi:8-oxo-dGTP diphosphatase
MKRLNPRTDRSPITKLTLTEGGLVARQIEVVGAVIVDDGLVLCAQRGPHGALAGLWEFPGGKIEPNETARDALEREIDEELRCVVEVGNEVTTTSHEYAFGVVTLTTFFCRLVDGVPQLTEHAAIKWLPAADLSTLEWAPADIPAVERIRAELA